MNENLFSWESIGLKNTTERELITGLAPVLLCLEKNNDGEIQSKLVIQIPINDDNPMYIDALKRAENDERLAKRILMLYTGFFLATNSEKLPFNNFVLLLDTFYKEVPKETTVNSILKDGQKIRDLPDKKECYMITYFDKKESFYTAMIPYDRDDKGKPAIREKDINCLSGEKYDMVSGLSSINGNEGYDRLIMQGYYDGLAKRVIG